MVSVMRLRNMSARNREQYGGSVWNWCVSRGEQTQGLQADNLRYSNGVDNYKNVVFSTLQYGHQSANE